MSEKFIAHTVFSVKRSDESTLALCSEITCEIMSEKKIAHMMVYLNYLFRNNHPSSGEMLEGEGHVLDMIPRYLTLGQAHECFVGKHIEKKFLETRTILDV